MKLRSSHRSCPIKSTVLKNFAIFTDKDVCWSLFLIFNKVKPIQRISKNNLRSGSFYKLTY